MVWIVIPSGARNLTVEAVTQSGMCEVTDYVRSFASLRMTARKQRRVPELLLFFVFEPKA